VYLLCLLLLCRQANQRLRTKVGSVSRRVAADFSLDETAAARLSLGLGDEDMPGISLFAMPMADLYGSPKVSSCVFQGCVHRTYA
jgi:hypothetical protein